MAETALSPPHPLRTIRLPVYGLNLSPIGGWILSPPKLLKDRCRFELGTPMMDVGSATTGPPFKRKPPILTDPMLTPSVGL